MRVGLVSTSRARVMLAAAAMALLVAGCDQGQPQASQPKAGAPAPTVSVSKPLQRTIVEWDEYTGRFDAVETVEIRARVSGYLNEVRFKDGQTVKQGDLLFAIDPRPFERALEQARAELFVAATKVENANLDVARGQPLIERKIISDKTFDDRMSLLRDAQAAVKVAEAKVKSAELDLSFATIAAPIAGRISRSLVTAGNWISAGSVSGATLLTTIVSQDPIYIYFDVNENNYIKYKRLAERGVGAADVGALVEVALPDEHGFPHKAQLDFLDNRLDQATGTLRARAVLANKAGLFSPGLFARVRVTGTPSYAAILIPDSAIGTDQTNKYVYVVAGDGTVARRNVKLGPLIDGLRVAREGLAGDDWVVTNGLQRVRPGLKVEPKRVAIAASEASSGGGAIPKAQE
ncbi:MAG: efflux RND transporter periplasmic adaptor subunit [Hyphomonadaceae bacterium]|jgi:RND family efflux transporter MFP subunit|nr:efflux RND transporter periplasmic adaptor subunit [Hyphomonadaceae bacterium]